MAHLKLLSAKLRHDRFGASAERGRKLLDRLELELEELEAAASETEGATVARERTVPSFQRHCGPVPAVHRCRPSGESSSSTPTPRSTCHPPKSARSRAAA